MTKSTKIVRKIGKSQLKIAKSTKKSRYFGAISMGVPLNLCIIGQLPYNIKN